MKSLGLSLLALTSLSAFSAQNINCSQINKNGSIKKNGIELILRLTSKKTGSVSVSGLTTNQSDSINQLIVNSVNQGTSIDDSPFTTIFLNPKRDDGMLDIQLQFKTFILSKNLMNEKATFVIGSDSAELEYGFSYGYDVVCNSFK